VPWTGTSSSQRGEPAARDELAWRVAALAEQAPDWKRAERTLGALASRSDLPAPRTVEAGFRAADAAAQQGRASASAAFSEAALARYQAWPTQDEAREHTRADVLAAQALVDLGDRRAAACAAIRLREPIERALSEKRAALTPRSRLCRSRHRRVPKPRPRPAQDRHG
jgi:hypothetical protein